MLISREKRFLFVHIQKTGGSSLREVLLRRVPDLESILGTHDTAFAARMHLGAEVYHGLTAAAFVRNPWDRLVSWYSMIEAARPPRSWWRRIGSPGSFRLWEYVYDNSRTFEEFIHRCTDEIDDVDGRKSFLKNQIDYISDPRGKRIVDFVGRFEVLHDDAARLFRRLGLPKVTLPRLNPSRHPHYSAFYSDDLAEVVRQRYVRDIIAFHYRFERVNVPRSKR